MYKKKEKEKQKERIQRDRGGGGEIYPQHIGDCGWSDADSLGSRSLAKPPLRLRSSTLLLHLVSPATLAIVNLAYILRLQL